MTPEEDLARFYAILDRLAAKSGGPRTLSECHGRMLWPRKGVYFFFEAGENRSLSGDGPRVVRVGTHAVSAGSKATLWQRLGAHRGTLSGGGNHRGSIFRLLVGEAVLRRGGLDLPSWAMASSPGEAARCLGTTRDELKQKEAALESQVSAIICAMPFLWLDIDDESGPDSLRAFVERNAIALLAGGASGQVDRPSGGWLGRFSKRQVVRECGVWNQDHVRALYDPSFLETLGEIVAAL